MTEEEPIPAVTPAVDPEPPVETPEPPVPESKPEPITPPSKMVERFAQKLQADLGDNYSTKLDNMPIEERINIMEVLLEVLSKNQPIHKTEGKIPLAPKPVVKTSPKTILQLQKESGFAEKMKGKGKYFKIMEKYYT